MNIRQLTTDDWQAWKALRLEGLADAPEAFSSSYEEEQQWSDERFIQTLKSNIVFGVFIQNKIVGTAAFYSMHTIRTRHKGCLWGMYIQPEHRGKGFAGELLKTIISYAKSHTHQLHLTVATINTPGIHLYQKFGFQIYGTEPNAVKIDTAFYDEYLMVLELKDE
jgi:RimJ/RimL family protein N-acetyltransferase